MMRSRAVKFFFGGAAAATLGFAAWTAMAEPNVALTRSADGTKVFDVRLVRGPFAMREIKGVVPLEENTGCYVVWSKKRVEVFRAGFTPSGAFDSSMVWGLDFAAEVRGVTPLGDNTTSFIVHTDTEHSLYKADWFPGI